MLGILWSLLTPLLMLAIYTFVFSEVFNARWHASPTQSSSKSEYAIVLFAGMIMFNLFSECISRAPSMVLSNANFVTKIIFPLETLPCVNLLSGLFHCAVSIGILLLAELAIRHTLPWTVVLIPIVMAPLCLLILGVSWWLAATGVFLRDIGQTIGIFITALMFLSPLFFPVSALPARFHKLAYLNPMAFPIEQSRAVLVFGTSIDWYAWGIYTAISLVVAWLGFAWFQMTRRGFADVL